MTNTNQTALDLDKLEALARAACPDNAWPFNVNAFRKYLTPANTLALIDLARRAKPTTESASAAGAGSEQAPAGRVAMWNPNGLGPYKAIELIDKKGFSLADTLPEGALVYLAAPSSSASELPAVVCKPCTSNDVECKNSGNLNINASPQALPHQPVGEQDERALRSMFERDAESFLGSPMVAYAPGFQKDDDGGYQYANTRRLFSFWKAARAAHQAATNPPAAQAVVAAPAEPTAWIAYYDGVKSQNVARDHKEKAEIENMAKVMGYDGRLTWEELFSHAAPAALTQQAAPEAQATSAGEVPTAWRLTTIAPEARNPLTFLYGYGARAHAAHKEWKGSTLTPLYERTAAVGAGEVPAKDDGAAWREGVLMAASVLMATHDQPTMAADVLNELGLSGSDCGALDEFDKRNLRKIQKDRPGLKLRGLTSRAAAKGTADQGAKECAERGQG